MSSRPLYLYFTTPFKEISKMGKTYVLDCGINQSTIYDAEKNIVSTISHDDVLKIHNVLEPNSTVICEYAHLGCPRGERSLSQPFEADELLTFYENLKEKNITLKLFPQQSTPRACAYSGLPKLDSNDPISIYKLISDFPQISMMNPPSSFDVSDKRKLSWDMKDAINYTLNVARRYGYNDKEDANTRAIKELFPKMLTDLSEETKKAFGICEKSKYQVSRSGQYKKGELNMNNISKVQLYSILACLQNEKGELRTVKGKTPSWKFVKRYILCMTPFHFRGGVARSNLYYHGMKNYIISKGKEKGLTLSGKKRGGFFNDKGDAIKKGSRFTKKEDDFFLKERKVYNNAIREVYRFFDKNLSPQTAGLPE
jgi:hypothetical protein